MRRLIGFTIAIATIAMAARVDALPMFSRKTGMACSACHDAWPRLNDVGELFRDRGYRTGAADDNSWGHFFAYFPISFRATVGYQFSSTTNQATDQGTTTINTGGFAFPAADIYFGGNIANHVSIYVDVAGFSKDGTAAVESTWIRINDIGTHWLNLKVGRLEMDLPFSMHRAHTIFTPFQIYEYHPTNSSNGFMLDENQLGVEIMGHQNGPGLRYSVIAASSGSITDAWAMSAPSLYGHVTYTKLFRSRILPRLRVGAMGDVGWWPTQFKTMTIPQSMPQPVAGTGFDHQLHAHTGADVQLVFGELARPITLTAVWMYGQEAAKLITNGTRDAQFHGGFVQLDYVPIIPLIIGLRYDGVYNIQQADPTQPANSNQKDAFTAFARYQAFSATWGSLVAHTELSTVNTQSTMGMPAVRSTSIFAGFDFLL
jgi:hypothetical protein